MIRLTVAAIKAALWLCVALYVVAALVVALTLGTIVAGVVLAVGRLTEGRS